MNRIYDMTTRCTTKRLVYDRVCLYRKDVHLFKRWKWSDSRVESSFNAYWISQAAKYSLQPPVFIGCAYTQISNLNAETWWNGWQHLQKPVVAKMRRSLTDQFVKAMETKARCRINEFCRVNLHLGIKIFWQHTVSSIGTRSVPIASMPFINVH